jgi:hypothetical protein
MSIRLKNRISEINCRSQKKKLFWQKGSTDDRVTLLPAKEHRNHPFTGLRISQVAPDNDFFNIKAGVDRWRTNASPAHD